ncbi:MAG: hypothetical protein C5S49_02205 [Candidatus Methanogaster sp.]|nr:MAG: hypothetical protein C5S49_02205 [ANME-2 cluster archaeon]
MSLPGEGRGAVQNPMITYATDVGGGHISPDEAQIKLARLFELFIGNLR